MKSLGCVKANMHRKGLTEQHLVFYQDAHDELIFLNGRAPTDAEILERARVMSEAAAQASQNDQKASSKQGLPRASQQMRSGRKSTKSSQVKTIRLTPTIRPAAKSRVQMRAAAAKAAKGQFAGQAKGLGPSFLSEDSTKLESRSSLIPIEQIQKEEERFGMDEFLDSPFLVLDDDHCSTLEERLKRMMEMLICDSGTSSTNLYDEHYQQQFDKSG